MGKYRRKFTREMKLAAVQRMEARATAAEVARAFEVNPTVVHRWRREFREGPGNAFPGLGKRRWAEGQVAELERKIGQQALEIDFFQSPPWPAATGNQRTATTPTRPQTSAHPKGIEERSCHAPCGRPPTSTEANTPATPPQTTPSPSSDRRHGWSNTWDSTGVVSRESTAGATRSSRSTPPRNRMGLRHS